MRLDENRSVRQSSFKKVHENNMHSTPGRKPAQLIIKIYEVREFEGGIKTNKQKLLNFTISLFFLLYSQRLH